MADWTGSIRQLGQHEHFTAVSWPDQHGRQWAFSVHDKSGHPQGMLTPDGWSAPIPQLTPPQSYLVPAPGKFSGRIIIDYPRWLADYADAGRQYAQWIVEVAKKNYPADAAHQIEQRNPFLMALAGAPPQSVQLVKAMAAGNAWALGLLKPNGTRYAQPEWAEGLLASWVPMETTGGVDGEQTYAAEDFPLALADQDVYEMPSAFVPDATPTDWFAGASAAVEADAPLVAAHTKRGK